MSKEENKIFFFGMAYGAGFAFIAIGIVILMIVPR